MIVYKEQIEKKNYLVARPVRPAVKSNIMKSEEPPPPAPFPLVEVVYDLEEPDK